MKDNVYYSPSLMCMDICNTKEQIEAFNQYCGMLHVDVMDGHFAKNITLSADFVKQIRKLTDLPIDCHLMVEHPDDFIEAFAEAGADYITLHAETIQNNSFREIMKIKALGKKVGIAICPATPIENIKSYLGLVDMLTIMTVEVGYAGQQFIPEMLPKIEEAKNYRARSGMNFIIQVDGAVGPKTYQNLYRAGARAFVMGSSGLFKKNDNRTIKELCIAMNNEFEDCINQRKIS